MTDTTSPTPLLCEVVHTTREEEEECERSRRTSPASEVQEEPPLRAFHEIRTAGLLWLVNHHVLHPRGVALALHVDDDGNAAGWSLLRSPDGGPWTFDAETNEHGRARAEATLTAAGALPLHELPPFTGDMGSCPKCHHLYASTAYRAPLTAREREEWNGFPRRGPLPERLERECERCSYRWDEAVGPAPDLPEPLTAQELTHALNNAAPYPVELFPHVAEAMAANLVQMLNAYARPDYVPGDLDVEARPRPAEDTLPTEDVPGLEDLEPVRAAYVRTMHQAVRELEDAHAHHAVPGVAPTAGYSARRVLRASALRLHRGEAVEAVLVSTVQALTHVLVGGEATSHAHTLTGLDV
ncbi:hypothetical protein WB388_40465 [Streptomyces brasiliscabiei]|uniref:Uncharacterized protein n=1 Tax=Streptomyces brasiliscabiei TaxID=2736302 RepID=A0ABU8GMD0_9ACTN